MEDLSKDNWGDPERVKEFARNYADRYGEVFWSTLMRMLPQTEFRVVADFGCGPGLWLAEAANRFQASQIYGLDASSAMLEYAERFIVRESNVEYNLLLVNLDTDSIPIKEGTIEMAFGGYMLHEVSSPEDFLGKVANLLSKEGVCVIFDFVSGNEERFVQQMVERGWSEDRARKRYPHMCKYSPDEIQSLMNVAGLEVIGTKVIDETRALVIASKKS